MHNRLYLTFNVFSDAVNSISSWNELFYSLLDDVESIEFRNIKYELAEKYKIIPTPEQIWDEKNKIMMLEFKGKYVEEFGLEFSSSRLFQKLCTRAYKIDIKFDKVRYVVDDPKLYEEEKFTDFSDILQSGEKGCYEFYGSDTKELFKQSSKDISWYKKYKDKKISYTINSHGYRCAEFSEVSWKDSILIFGCSNSFGIGLDDKETLDHLIEDYSGITTLNLSVPGSSIEFAMHNSMNFKKKFGNPKAIIFVWTSHLRTVRYFKSTTHIGAWSQKKYLELISDFDHQKSTATINYFITKEIWKDVPQFHCTFFPDVAFLLDVPLLPKLDFSRDGHPGPESTMESAKFIWNNLKSSI